MRLAYIANYALGHDIAGRTLVKFSDDVFLVAYPGSGGQWLRCLAGNLIDPSHPVTAGNIMRRVPDLYHLSRRAFKRVARPRVIFSHECLDADCHVRVVYLVRDPRDVAVSNFEQRRKGGAIDGSLSLAQFVSTVFTKSDEYQGGWAEEFSQAIMANNGAAYRSRLKDEFLGTPASWGENVMSWLGARGHDSKTFLLLRYEDLCDDPVLALTPVSHFLGLDASPKRVRAAVAATRDSRAAASAEFEAPGKWKARLPESAVIQIESAWGPLMTTLGYAAPPVAVGLQST
ncbi:MAG TPA: sulfotransferase domain-containing protein [Blastocatellia bacterium]|nr:sulfotransferase domain-containing protein [Blastocatellia bacterium]